MAFASIARTLNGIRLNQTFWRLIWENSKGKKNWEAKRLQFRDRDENFAEILLEIVVFKRSRAANRCIIITSPSLAHE